MSRLKILRRAARHQAKNLLAALSGRKLTQVSLSSMTLDEDDVALAERWLKDRTAWHDEPVVSNYEKTFAAWNGSKHASAFMSGRVALSACLHALELQPGDEVIVPGYTCVVVANAFEFAGVRPAYADIELDTYGLDAEQLPGRITSRTRAILIQHLYGLVCRDYEAILKIAAAHGLKVIEDCAHACGAEYHGTKVGNRGDVAFYSSEQSKVFNTIQGGLAVTNQDALAVRLREYCQAAAVPDEAWIDRQLHNVILNFFQFKHPGRWWRGDWANWCHGSKRLVSTTKDEERGTRPAHYGRRMPAPIAALGLNQLRKIDGYNKQRRATARHWDQWCAARGYTPPRVVEGSVPVFLRYPVLVEPERKQDRAWAKRELNVELGVWFASHLHPSHRPVTGCPNADTAVARCINLPCLGVPL